MEAQSHLKLTLMNVQGLLGKHFSKDVGQAVLPRKEWVSEGSWKIIQERKELKNATKESKAQVPLLWRRAHSESLGM